ncbi:M48 family metalloprotease [Actinomycetospora cinnamomea]|uniref:M48 family metalloprotease n=1 Tax=Actinomycetospora cinnamomea TaxID=663609 RepID=UPI00140409D3|nr:M48 family metalloprotease [Actinomycetospora cinnamomea]
MSLAAAGLFAASWFLVLRPGSTRVTTSGGSCADVGSPAPTASPIDAFLACSSDALAGEAALVLVGPVALAVLASVGWFLAPRVLTRWWRDLDLEPPGPRHDALDRLAREEGLEHLPTWYRTVRTGAWTYGRWPRHRVVVGLDVLTGFRGDKDERRWRALISHEVAHLRNRDVDRTYWTLCAFFAFLLIVATPLVVDAFVSSRVGPSLSWRVVAIVLVVVLSVAAVLRTREHDADLRAASSDSGGMREAIAWSLAKREPSSRPRWLRTHPRDAERLAVVDDPSRALWISPVEFLAAGIAAGVVLVELPAVLEGLLEATPGGAVTAYLVAGWLTGLPLVGVVGLASWRAAVAAADTGTRAPRGLVPGVALAAGLLAGSQIAPRSSAAWVTVFATSGDRAFSPRLGNVAVPTALWLVAVLVLIGLLFVTWSVAMGEAFTTSRRPVDVRVARHVLLGATVLCVPLGGWFLALRLAAADAVDPATLAASFVGYHALEALLVVTLVAATALAWCTSRWLVLPGAIVAGVALAAVVLLPVAVPTREDPRAGGANLALPAFPQAGNACLWLMHVRPLDGDPDYQRRFGAALSATDDALMREIGAALVASADDPDGAAALSARTALVRRCDAFSTGR